jgi:hypothetical protein
VLELTGGMLARLVLLWLERRQLDGVEGTAKVVEERG